MSATERLEVAEDRPVLSYAPPPKRASVGHRIAYYAIRGVCILVLLYFYAIGVGMIVMAFRRSAEPGSYESRFFLLGPAVLLGATGLLVVTKRWTKQLAGRWNIVAASDAHENSRD